MAKITTVIDIGSNSCRMVVFSKSSRFAFNLLNETKSKVRISEGCYKHNGNLQAVPMQRTYDALESFIKISKSLKSKKILCVATSALRDAPNAAEFKSKIAKDLGIQIKVIDGQKEAFFGAIAANNLLHVNDFVTVDIGGGSTEFALVKNSRIVDTFSLNIGTIRLKEFLENSLQDNKDQIYFKSHALAFIEQELHKLPPTFKNKTLVGIGGTIRALSRVMIKKDKNALGVIHGFEYSTKKALKTFNTITDIHTPIDELLNLGIKSDRLDTIREGTLIFIACIQRLGSSKIVTSGVGVREGVYLHDILRSSNLRLPTNFDVSVRSLLDRFSIDQVLTRKLAATSTYLYDLLAPLHLLGDLYKNELLTASKLSTIGNFLNFYRYSFHSFNFILNGLHYGFSHQQRVLIAYIIKTSKKTLPKKEDIKEHKSFLPPLEELQWLSFIMSLSNNLNIDHNGIDYFKQIRLDNNTLIVDENLSFLIKEAIDKIEAPKQLTVRFERF
jgi:exopolyphosphatase/guanosine-5'-triphosphate,3'-diphosphate pyrophosphatase